MSWGPLLAAAVHGAAAVRDRIEAEGWELLWTGEVLDQDGEPVPLHEVAQALAAPKLERVDVVDVTDL